MRKPDLKAKLRLGFYVFGALMLIEVVEYVVGTTFQRGVWPFLLAWAAVGAWPIVSYFMHIKQLWRSEVQEE